MKILDHNFLHVILKQQFIFHSKNIPFPIILPFAFQQVPLPHATFPAPQPLDVLEGTVASTLPTSLFSFGAFKGYTTVHQSPGDVLLLETVLLCIYVGVQSQGYNLILLYVKIFFTHYHVCR